MSKKIFYESIGQSIRLARQKKGKTIAELAHDIEIAVSYMSKIENSKKNATIWTLHKVCSALQVSLSRIITKAVKDSKNEKPTTK